MVLWRKLRPRLPQQHWLISKTLAFCQFFTKPTLVWEAKSFHFTGDDRRRQKILTQIFFSIFKIFSQFFFSTTGGVMSFFCSCKTFLTRKTIFPDVFFSLLLRKRSLSLRTKQHHNRSTTGEKNSIENFSFTTSLRSKTRVLKLALVGTSLDTPVAWLEC